MKNLLTYEEFLNEVAADKITVKLSAKAAKSMGKELNDNGVKYRMIRPTVFELDDTPKARMAIKLAKERFGAQDVIVETLNEDLNITKKTIFIDDLEFASSDFHKNMNWKDAKKACEDLGDGWRLPTIEELMNLDLDDRLKLGLWQNSWWTGTEGPGSSAYLYGSSSNPAKKFQSFKSDTWKVRAVRKN